MRKELREIKRTFPGAEITTTGSNHYRVAMSDGRIVIISNTPSRQNFMRNAVADARRQSKIQHRTNKGED
jgi:hypothetical protein